MQQALEALELLAKYENPATKIQVRKPKDGGPIVTMYPHKVATEAAAPLRERLAQPEQEPVAHTLNCVCGAVWDIKADGSEEMVHTPDITPPQRKPLTDEEISDAVREADFDWHYGWTLEDEEPNRFTKFARAIEAKLKEKNNG
jgi:hypothetical protein